MVDGVSDDVGDLFDDLIEEAEGVRERVRKQAASGRARHHRGSGRRRRRSRDESDTDRSDRGGDSDADIEAEFDRDEAAEGSGGASANESGIPDPDEAGPAEARPRAAELFPDILGWQPLVLNRDFECGRCKRNLAAGESAFLGLGETGLTRIALCGRCAGSR